VSHLESVAFFLPLNDLFAAYYWLTSYSKLFLESVLLTLARSVACCGVILPIGFGGHAMPDTSLTNNQPHFVNRLVSLCLFVMVVA